MEDGRTDGRKLLKGSRWCSAVVVDVREEESVQREGGDEEGSGREAEGFV